MNSRVLTALTAAILMSLTACGDDATGPNGNGNGQPSAIQTGAWPASTGTSAFTFTFTVGADAVSISEIEFGFSSWRCGSASATLSGTVATTYTGTPPAITNRAFSMSVDVNGDPFGSPWPVEIDGTFADSGADASGTWEASIAGGTCSGDWTASP